MKLIIDGLPDEFVEFLKQLMIMWLPEAKEDGENE